MAEEREQLRISAELDTSKLQQDAKKGLNTVVNEEKKVENQARQTSKAVEGIGTSLNNASQKGTQALKQMGNEAEKTAKKISSIEASVKNIKLGQAIGLAQKFVDSDTGKFVGNQLGDAMGLDESQKGLAGGAVKGGLAGAAIGMQIGGGPGAAIGALVGAGAGLMGAAKEQEKAALALLKSADERQKINRDRTKAIDEAERKEKEQAKFNDDFQKMISEGNFEGAQKLIDEKKAEAQKVFETGDKAIHNSTIQMDAVPLEKRGAGYKSYDDWLNMRTEGKQGLATMSKYQQVLDNAVAKANQPQPEKPGKPEKEKEPEPTYEYDLNWRPKPGSSQNLTDSLTRIGGGSGYSSINIQTKMASNMQSIDKTLKEMLVLVKNENNSETEAVF